MSTTTTDRAAADGHTYTFNVTMTCGGCSGAIERVLGKMQGIKSYDVDLDSQTATVHPDVDPTAASYEAVLERIKKTGKKVNGGAVDGVERGV